MKTIFAGYILFAVVLITSQNTIAQVLSPTEPESAGMSSSKLENMDRLIQNYIDERKIPGGVFLLARGGNLIYHKAFGIKNIVTNEPYQIDDIFRIASMSKAITTVSIMQLYEKGMLGIDEPVWKYIPAFKNQQVLDTFNENDSSYTTVPVESPVTIRHLLTHTSGIVYGSSNRKDLRILYKEFNLEDAGLSHPSLTTQEFANQIAKVPLAFQPGERYHYGLNMDVLGRIIEVVSGLSLDKYFRQNIFEPLEMEDTWFYLPKEKHNRLVPVFTPTENGFEFSKEENGRFAYPKTSGRNFFAGGGGLSSTAIDYAKFIESLLNNGYYNDYQILSRKTIELMTSDQMIQLNEKGTGFSKIPGLTYCLGFSLITEDGKGINSKSVGTYEWGGYFNTKFFIDPQEDLIFVGMTQVVPYPHGDFWNKMYAIIYGSIID